MFPLRVCRCVRHMRQCIHLCQHSFMSSGVLWGTCASACGRGLRSLAFSVVCSCTHASACVEPALVSLCSQRSSITHMRVDPSCLLQRHSTFEHSFWIVPPYPSPFFHCIYYISVTGALLPFCVGAHGWVARICQPWEQSHLGAGCQ